MVTAENKAMAADRSQCRRCQGKKQIKAADGKVVACPACKGFGVQYQTK